MKEIVYKFCDGSVDKVLVEDSFYEVYMKLAKVDELNDVKETRRHISLEEMTDKDIELGTSEDALSMLINEEEMQANIKIQEKEKERLLAKIRSLKLVQRKIIYKYFFLNENQQKIADDLGCNQCTISRVISCFLSSFSA